jgi:hypothetical protein
MANCRLSHPVASMRDYSRSKSIVSAEHVVLPPAIVVSREKSNRLADLLPLVPTLLKAAKPKVTGEECYAPRVLTP